MVRVATALQNEASLIDSAAALLEKGQ
jgi:hypothetical protein